MNRELQDLVISVISTIFLILSIFLFKDKVTHSEKIILPGNSINTSNASDPLQKIKIDHENEKFVKNWILECQVRLNVDQTRFNFDVDQEFYNNYPSMENRSLSSSGSEDFLYRVDWYKIAIKQLSVTTSFSTTCQIPTQILG